MGQVVTQNVLELTSIVPHNSLATYCLEQLRPGCKDVESYKKSLFLIRVQESLDGVPMVILPIVLDGPDGVGKTTICQHMQESLHIPCIANPCNQLPTGKYLRNAVTEGTLFTNFPVQTVQTLFAGAMAELVQALAWNPTALFTGVSTSSIPCWTATPASSDSPILRIVPVLVDRGFPSLLCNGYSQGLATDFLKSLASLYSPLPTVILNATPAVLEQRVMGRTLDKVLAAQTPIVVSRMQTAYGALQAFYLAHSSLFPGVAWADAKQAYSTVHAADTIPDLIGSLYWYIRELCTGVAKIYEHSSELNPSIPGIIPPRDLAQLLTTLDLASIS